MRHYIKPEIKIVNFISENILTESTGWTDNGPGSTENGGNVPGEIVGYNVPYAAKVEVAF
ncbi:MAG: hypothetical protein UIM24_04035 [Clostridia bacterium]|nr:hypothetical protein [Clostridia bacterium]